MLGAQMQQIPASGLFAILTLSPLHIAIGGSWKLSALASGALVVAGSQPLRPLCGPAPKC